MGKSYSREISDTINRVLNIDQLKFSFDSAQGLFRFGVTLKGKLKKTNLFIDVKDMGYAVYAISPIGVDENDQNMLTEMAKFICRANYNLLNGNFEMDMKDGEIRYKVYEDCSGGVIPTALMVKNSYILPALMFERFGDGILGIIYAGLSAEDAIQKCEQN